MNDSPEKPPVYAGTFYHIGDSRNDDHTIATLRAQLAEVERERDRLRKQLREWIAANGRGGWIDDLRNRVESLEQQP